MFLSPVLSPFSLPIHPLDLLVSDVIRTNELQVWFLSEHVVETPLVQAT